MDTAGKNSKKVAEYIQNQLKEDEGHDQLTMGEYASGYRLGTLSANQWRTRWGHLLEKRLNGESLFKVLEGFAVSHLS